MSNPARDTRARDLGVIHKAKKALGWTDEDYRAILHQVTGVRSAADLDAAGRQRFIKHLGACGFKPAAPPAKQSSRPFTQARKIEWLWAKLRAAGALKDSTPASLLAFVGRVTGKGVSSLDFLPNADASTAIEALKSWLQRTERANRDAAQEAAAR